MIGVVQLLVLIGMMFVGAQARAADPNGQSMSKRQLFAQMVDCVKKRMSADKGRSYNEAVKACKDDLDKKNDDLSSEALVASESQPKQ